MRRFASWVLMVKCNAWPNAVLVLVSLGFWQ
jgi:hypothetical protein